MALLEEANMMIYEISLEVRDADVLPINLLVSALSFSFINTNSVNSTS